jgi:SAM-dependent methyltransferase
MLERMHLVLRNPRHLWQYWVQPFFPIHRVAIYLGLYVRYLGTWFRYKSLATGEPLSFLDSYPCLFDFGDTTSFDSHYFYQAVWAMERIIRCGAKRHVDIGSDIQFVGMLTTQLPVTFVDIRFLSAKLPRLTSIAANIVTLPFSDGSVDSLSCLHVAEHVGLGRYGDPLDPFGTRRACAELVRVLAPNGNLFFAVPVGHARVCFNAHRIHTPRQILNYFDTLKLVEFSAVDDNGQLRINVPHERVESCNYACGLFWFRRAMH